MLTANAAPTFDASDAASFPGPYGSYEEFSADLGLMFKVMETQAISFASTLLTLADGGEITDYRGKIEGRFRRDGDLHIIAAGGVIVNYSAWHREMLARAATHWNV